MATETDLPLHLATSDGPAPAVEVTSPLYLGDADKDKVLTMLHGDDEDDVVVGWGTKLRHKRGEMLGRMSIDMDESEFDQLPARRVEMMPNKTEGTAGDELDLLSGDEDPAPFRSLATATEERFPVLSSVLRRYQEADLQPRAVRIDTPESHAEFVAEAAVREIERRLSDLEARVQAHLDDPYAHPHAHEDGQMVPLTRSEVLGAVQAVGALQKARTSDDAAAALPQVPLDLPGFARGKVKCWRDGDAVVCALKFVAADGTPRVATMAALPKVKAEDVAGFSRRSGLHPVTVLGALADLADVSTAKRLVRDCAGAALKVHRRVDVVGMGAEPLLFVQPRRGRAWPVQALMELQAKCNAGDRQACREMAALEAAAETPTGQRVAKPLLTEARRQLASPARSTLLGGGASWGETFKARYAQMGLCL